MNLLFLIIGFLMGIVGTIIFAVMYTSSEQSHAEDEFNRNQE